MSYLDTPRLHFFGQFFADPSTLNNTLSNQAGQITGQPLGLVAQTWINAGCPQ